MATVKLHTELRVYQLAFKSAMGIFYLTKNFPVEERYSLTDQIRRSSRSVCANITESWRKRRYIKYFEFKLSDAEGEAAETQNWLDFAKECNYITFEKHAELTEKCNFIIGMIVNMITNSDKWAISNSEGKPPKPSNS